MYLRLLYESFNFAWQALKSNVLRTILSLLGVTVGIFAIIAAYTVADAMTRSINDSLSFLGEKVIYVQKWPWVFDANFPWWKYFNRPSPKYAEYKYLEKNLVNQAGTSIFDSKGGLTLKSKNNSIEDIAALGVSYAYNVVTEIPIENGRYFVPQETESGKHVALIGYEIANTLFPNSNPIGQTFKIRGIPFVVIATLKKQGSGLIGGPDFDKATFIPYDAFSRMFQSRYSDPTIAVKGLPDDEGLLELEAEMRGIMRGKRGLKPSEDDSFSLNRPEMAASVVASIS
ncbi:MAG: ABC transporter permease, partial [Verrucomicrobia bacterium]|nr:ABC transporter permease [Cytophagales bacterium]